MNNEATQKTGTMINTRSGIMLFRMLSQRSALELEILGMKKRGRTAYSMIKEEYNLKGSKRKVLYDFNELIQGVDMKKL
jgi:hypothetical protein